MPFKSTQQRRYMFAKLPKITNRWAHQYATTPRKKRPTPRPN